MSQGFSLYQPGRINDMNPQSLAIGHLQDGRSRDMIPNQPFSQVFTDTKGYGEKRFDMGRKTTLTAPDGMPDSAFLGSTIDHMIFTDDNWYVTEIMPWELAPQANEIIWNEIIFDKHLASPTPHLGVVRLVDSQRKQNSASFVRWGIGYAMEHSFLTMEEGIQYHLHHLQQMALASLETAKFDVIYTLMQAHEHEKNIEMERGSLTKGALLDAIQEDVWMFAALQKYKRPINSLEVHINEAMSKYGGRADSWIYPPQAINFLSVVPDEYLSYKEAGPRGPEMVFNPDGPGPFSRIASAKIYIARTYHVDQLAGRNNLLEAEKQVGEYYQMKDFYRDDHRGYTSKCRHIEIYDEDNDCWSEISL